MTDQNEVPYVFLDAVPDRISVSEVYAYQMWIRANPDIQLLQGPEENRRPRGEIRVEIPYDGFYYMPAGQTERFKDRASSAGRLDAQIGWLAMGKPLDWEGDWQPQPGLDALLPVRIPLLSEERLGPADWTTDELRAVVCHDYEPEAPRYFPLQVEMEVYDSTEDDLKTREAVIKEVEKAENLQAILNLLNGDQLQGGLLVIDLNITANLPNDFLDEDAGNITAVLEELHLQWPVIIPQSQLGIFKSPFQADDEIVWRYNPDWGTVEIKNLSMEFDKANRRSASTLWSFRLSLRLILISAGEIVNRDELKGWARVRLDGCLLSSREAAWLDTQGHRLPQEVLDERKRHELVEVQTYLHSEFEATLSERFSQRNSAVYRQWYFHGLKFSAARLDDIAAALRDLGYLVDSARQANATRIIDRSDKEDPDSLSVGVVVGSRYDLRPDASPTALYLEVWAIPVARADTRRERSIPEGGIVSTEMGTSDMMVQVRGGIKGGGSLLALDADRLMTDLKRRFMAIADLR